MKKSTSSISAPQTDCTASCLDSSSSSMTLVGSFALSFTAVSCIPSDSGDRGQCVTVFEARKYGVPLRILFLFLISTSAISCIRSPSKLQCRKRVSKKAEIRSSSTVGWVVSPLLPGSSDTGRRGIAAMISRACSTVYSTNDFGLTHGEMI